MQLHFYASVETINGIQEGHEMSVHSNKDTAPLGFIEVSFDIEKYSIKKYEKSNSLFFVKKK